jgi:hypothetical protein
VQGIRDRRRGRLRTSAPVRSFFTYQGDARSLMLTLSFVVLMTTFTKLGHMESTWSRKRTEGSGPVAFLPLCRLCLYLSHSLSPLHFLPFASICIQLLYDNKKVGDEKEQSRLGGVKRPEKGGKEQTRFKSCCLDATWTELSP